LEGVGDFLDEGVEERLDVLGLFASEDVELDCVFEAHE
jgi:hypothetical protein